MGLVYYFSDYKSKVLILKNEHTSNLLDLAEYNNEILGVNNSNLVVFNNSHFIEKQKFNSALSSIRNIDKTLWIGSNDGLIIYRHDSLEKIPLSKNMVIKSIIPSRNRNHLWIGTNDGIIYFNIEQAQSVFKITAKDGLSGNEVIQNGLYLDNKGLLWVSTYHGLSNFNLKGSIETQSSPRCYLEDLKVNDISISFKEHQKLKYNQNNISFELSGLFYSDEKSVIFEHYLRNNNSSPNYFRSNKEHTIYYNNLFPGDYEFIYRAKGKDGIWSDSSAYSFTIEKAFWQTWAFMITTFILAMLILFLIHKMNVRRIEQQKNHLEKIVKERTVDLEEANKLVVEQMKIAEEQNHQITNSIYYAQRIQKSLLPNELSFRKHIQDFFVLFKPRDIVSGDFYWMTKMDEHLLIAAVDCTGHGVPGAFMSMLGISFLKEIVERERKADPASIMNEMRKAVITALQQDKAHGISKDGMDMSLVSIHLESLEMKFAGANNPVYVIKQNASETTETKNERIKTKDGILFEIKGDKMPIAIYDRMNDFENVLYQLDKGDRVYLFSDGYIDQFGGEKGKKFKSTPFKKMLLDQKRIPLYESKSILEKTFETWRGKEDQIDDVTLIGVEI